ncbi:hypothetical protein [Thalassolituus alkanivorans]|uniref:hypothetical protein n=1 Tax=Thalassolituus alkanivorans TaxID=2881055 RepID=UPI001E51A46F|nr:hypothetical protein [Thalassolituus alkanivorans]MCB2386563.1 hypothetical protein [Thalassolituus alkanivorans]MCB2424259.1 hypothetical protein [Thalassolituus alkanivorans]
MPFALRANLRLFNFDPVKIVLVRSIFLTMRPCDIPVAARSLGIHAQRIRKIIVHCGGPQAHKNHYAKPHFKADAPLWEWLLAAIRNDG